MSNLKSKLTGFLLVIALVFTMPFMAGVVNAADDELQGEAYAVYDSSDNSLTFFRDYEGKYQHGQKEGSKTYYTGIESTEYNEDTYPSWNNGSAAIPAQITKVSFNGVIRPKSCFAWFWGMSSLTGISNLQNLDVSDVTNMDQMFCGCSSLSSLDLSSFDTPNLLSTRSMFEGCNNLSSLNIINLDVSKVIDMGYMFSGCKSLDSLDLSCFDMSSVDDVECMFQNCINLTATLNILRMPSKYTHMFYFTTTENGRFTVKYLPPVTSENVDTLIKTNSIPGADIVNGGKGLAPAVVRLVKEKRKELETFDLAKYSEPEKNKVETLMDSTEEVLNKATTVDTVETAMKNFYEEIAKLKTESEKVQDLTEQITSLINDINRMNLTLYIDETANPLSDVIFEAEMLINKQDVTSNELITVKEQIDEALGNLVSKAEVLKEAKNNTIKAIDKVFNSVDMSIYDTAGQTDIKNLVNKAKSDVNSISDFNDIGKLDKIVTKLEKDIDAVKTKEEKAAEELAIARSNAENKIVEAENINKTQLTKEGKARLEDAINVVRNTLTNGNSTKEQINEAVYNLTATIDSLEYFPLNIEGEIGPDFPVLFSTAEKAVLSQSGNKDVKGSTYRYLQLKSEKQGKKNIKLSWKKVKGANAYTVYGSVAGKSKMKKLKTVSGTTFTVKKVGKKLEAKKYYKFTVIASSGEVAQAIAKTVFVTPKGPKKAINNTKVAVDKKVIKKAKKLKIGESLFVKVKALKAKGTKVKKCAEVRYESSDAKIAKVNSKGKLKAIGKGKCKIFCYAQNGVSKTVSVLVK